MRKHMSRFHCSEQGGAAKFAVVVESVIHCNPYNLPEQDEVSFKRLSGLIIFDLALCNCVVLLMRYLGIVKGPGYPREQVGAVPPPNFSEARPG